MFNSHFVVLAVPAVDQALLPVRTSAGSVMTLFGLCIYVGLALERSKSNKGISCEKVEKFQKLDGTNFYLYDAMSYKTKSKDGHWYIRKKNKKLQAIEV